MEPLIGVVGMLVLAGVYVLPGLADRGGHGCGGCGREEGPEGACGGCAAAGPPADDEERR